MIINLRGIRALQQLRIEHQESAGLDFPESCLTEMLFLYDVCKSLDLSLFQAREVLGALAWEMVTNYINSPVGFPTEAARQLVNSAALYDPLPFRTQS
jgi:hypothetical protein